MQHEGLPGDLIDILRAAESDDGQQSFPVIGARHKDGHIGGRPHQIHMVLPQIVAAMLRMLLFEQAVGITGGKPLIVQYPHPHIVLFGRCQNDVHLLPPAGAGIILEGTGLHTDLPDAAAVDCFNLRLDRFRMCLVRPQKRQHIAALLSVHDLFQSLVHAVILHSTV